MLKMASAVAASLLVVLTAGLSEAAGAAPAPGATLTQLVQAVGGRGATQNVARYAYLEKIDSHLQDVAAARLGAGSVAGAAVAARRQGLEISPQGDVAVDVYVNGDAAQAADALRAAGMHVGAISARAPQRMVAGTLPASALATVAGLPVTHAILSTTPPAFGATLSEGDAAIDGPQARALGPRGAGVLVGVISDSIDEVGGGVADSQASGDLPANVQIIRDDPSPGEDEGRAMAEIVYDEAPDLSGIVFVTANGFGPAGKAADIDRLVANGVKVIADDTGYLTDPLFQDGVIAQAVNRARTAGVAYFANAGNDADQSWEGAFSPSGASEDFDPGAGVDTIQTVGTIPANGRARVVLQWAEPWGHAPTDFALDIYDGSTLFQTIDSNNLVTGIPEETAAITAGSSAFALGVGIRRIAGTGTPLLKLVDWTNGASTTAFEYPTNSGTIWPGAATARGALTVAASPYGSPYGTPTTPETYSSVGPVTAYFDANGAPLAAPDVRQKPELGAPDAVSTSVPGFAPFYGTSAAAPAAAGIAALIRSAKPAMGVDELYAIMTAPANALDCTLSALVPDPNCGAGFLLADRALAMALDPTPPVITPTVTPAAPDGANGWYRGPVSVTWSVSDGESPVVLPSRCDPASPGEGVAALTCSAISAGGTTSVPLTIKRDATPPSAPAFAGIAAKGYLTTAFPAASAVSCAGTDTASVVTCAVSGYSAATGAHTLTAVATNAAGLTTSGTLAYRVTRPAAIAKLSFPKSLKLGKLETSGITITLRSAAGSTRVVVKLSARVPRAAGKGTVVVALAGLTKKVSAGTKHLKITLPARARKRLSSVSKATLLITVSATAAKTKRATLRGSIAARR